MGRPKVPLRNRLHTWFLLTVGIIYCLLFTLVHYTNVWAQELTSRSIVVSSAVPSAVVSHTFSFTPTSVTNIGSVVFEYCENTPVFDQNCDAPVGLDVDSANLSTQSGNTGFSIDNTNTTASRLVLTRTAVPGLAVPSSYAFNNITNPSNAPHSEFIRISTHASTDGTGPRTDNGAVAYAIHTPLNVAAYIPPFLNFCVGVSVALDCTSTVGDSIDMGILSRSAANASTSQFSTATNDPSGYVIYVLGNTMTSGNNTIPALVVPFPSLPGASQFGINLRDNSSPNVGVEPFGIGTGVPSANYNFPNFYSFVGGDFIASSTLPSDYTRMTVSYLVNASNSQPPGVYTTTLTYLATVQF